MTWVQAGDEGDGVRDGPTSALSPSSNGRSREIPTAALGRQRQFAARTSGHSIVYDVERQLPKWTCLPETEAANVGFEQQLTFDHES
jgi:hypothetical protein